MAGARSRRWTPCCGGSSRPRRDELRIDAQAGGRHGCSGLYATRRRGSDARPYRTVVSGVDPIEGRCDCPDFLKNSLGVCKHILVVLEHLYARPRLLQQALKEQERAASRAAGRACAGTRSGRLTGLGDWLERVAWLGAAEAKGRRRGTRSRALDVVPATGKDGALVLKNDLSATTPRSGWSWSRTCSRPSPPAPAAPATTRRCAPC